LKAKEQVSFEAFQALDIRVGRIVRAEAFPEAKKSAYKLWIDFGPEIGVKQSSAQISALYALETLVECQVMGVVNLAPRQIGPFKSEVLTLGFADPEGRVVLATPEREVSLGAHLH
jgi:tRNA-binding protein